MLRHFSPSLPSLAQDTFVALANAAKRMPISERALWEGRIEHIYGDISGQRALSASDVLGETVAYSEISVVDIIIAAETLFVLVCNLIAVSATENSPAGWLQSVSKQATDQLIETFADVSSGRAFSQRGIGGFELQFHFNWYVEPFEKRGWHCLRGMAELISQLWDGRQFLIPGLDPIQKLHDVLIPKNLRHVTGQFYTPEWLAAQLIEDSRWSPGKTLIDPFAGSGVFILAALRRAAMQGTRPAEIINDICAIELNPSACVAIRTNLILFFKDELAAQAFTLKPAIFCADALAPSIHEGVCHGDIFSSASRSLLIDGERYDPSGLTTPSIKIAIKSSLSDFGIGCGQVVAPNADIHASSIALEKSVRGRRIIEHLAVFFLKPADVLATNPPWIGWEYMSRQYRAYVQPAWEKYGLFTATGRERSFLKEDLSNMAMIAVWDRFLRNGGISVAVLRPATMHSDLTAKGMRRLSLRPKSDPIALTEIRSFSGIRVFAGAQTDAATWRITKGEETKFPVTAIEWCRTEARWQPESHDDVSTVLSNTTVKHRVALRTNPSDPTSRWAITDEEAARTVGMLTGSNGYKARIGVFTGGANAVYYVRRERGVGAGLGLYTNIVERAKRQIDEESFLCEDQLAFPILRGRDLSRWQATPELYILCPHTAETKMKPLGATTLSSTCPNGFHWLTRHKDFLLSRGGFAGWEKHVLKESFYAIQRIGDYTFAPHKVCWRYIANDFVVAVSSAQDGHSVLPNDKVIFISFSDEEAAYFVCGFLSAALVRAHLVSSMSGRQISANMIRDLPIPDFCKDDALHRSISDLTLKGHTAVATGALTLADHLQDEIDICVARLLGADLKAVAASKSALLSRGIDLSFQR